MAKALDVAKYVLCLKHIDEKFNKVYSLNMLKLQLCIYFINGIHSALNGRKKLIEESFEAWTYGPYISNVYYSFNHNAFRDISFTEKEYWEIMSRLGNKELSPLSDEERVFIDSIWHSVKWELSTTLSNIATSEESPWSKSINNGKLEIEDEDIFDYFDEAISRRKV